MKEFQQALSNASTSNKNLKVSYLELLLKAEKLLRFCILLLSLLLIAWVIFELQTNRLNLTNPHAWNWLLKKWRPYIHYLYLLCWLELGLTTVIGIIFLIQKHIWKAVKLFILAVGLFVLVAATLGIGSIISDLMWEFWYVECRGENNVIECVSRKQLNCLQLFRCI